MIQTQAVCAGDMHPVQLLVDAHPRFVEVRHVAVDQLFFGRLFKTFQFVVAALLQITDGSLTQRDAEHILHHLLQPFIRQ